MQTYFNAEAATLTLLLGAGLFCLVFVVACILCFACAIIEDANAEGIDHGDERRRHDRPHR